jgi:integrase
MPRKPGLWFRRQRCAWYTKLNGRPIMLAKGRENKAEATKALHSLMLEHLGSTPSSTGRDLEVGDLVVRWLADVDRRVERRELAEVTRSSYERRLAGFVEAVGAIRVSELQPHHVRTWLDSRTSWGATSRHDGVNTAKLIFRWGVDEGLIDRDPIARLKRPPRRERREEVLAPEQWPAFLAGIRSEGFRDLVTFLHETGARPGEAARVTAGDVDLQAGTVRIREHKTARKTGRARTIWLTEAAAAICRRLALAHPEGAIFRSAKGNAWTKDAINCQVCRIRGRSGLGHEATAYAIRHLFGTDCLTKGVPLALTAELMGHTNVATVARWYNHTSERSEALRDALAAVRPGEDPGADRRQVG